MKRLRLDGASLRRRSKRELARREHFPRPRLANKEGDAFLLAAYQDPEVVQTSSIKPIM